ncbi:hypothetical protein [Enterobacter roggenkampii]|uniref:hypothetical protein n=1 Tax=Enterobacter roggenkampii TaxID=1812935 RepID=UPI0039C29132
MKKGILLPALLITAISGCSTSVKTNGEKSQQQYDENYSPAKTFSSSGKVKERYKSVHQLKSDFLKETGSNLDADTALCHGDNACYHRAYLSSFERGIQQYQSDLKERKLKDERDCAANKQCSLSRKIEDNKRILVSGYQYVLADSPYDQGGADYAVRTICKNATSAQKSGIGKDTYVNALRDEPGASPRGRAIAVKIASACWNLSSLGYNWNEALRTE